MVALLAAWLLLGGSQQLPPAPVNAAFEETGTGTGTPPGWSLFASPSSGFVVDAAPGKSGGGARLRHADAANPAAPTEAMLAENIDAAAYRGRLVRLRANLKVLKPGSRVGVMLQVWRPQPNFAGFHYGMEDRPAPAGDWTSYEIVGRVASDAERITIGIGGMGDADVVVDDVSLEIVEPNPAPPSAEAAAYLGHAIDLARSNHIDGRKIDWASVTTNAQAEIGGARTPGDTYNAIRGVIGAIGNKHTMFLPPALVSPPTPTAAQAGKVAAAPPPPEMPTWRLVDGRFGLVHLPMLGTFGPAGEALGRSYSQLVQGGLQEMDKAPICGWIVDLRGNTGGNMWPMLQGIDPLLGDGPFGAFVDPAGNVTRWQRFNHRVTAGPMQASGEAPSFGLAHASAPLAVLIDGRTWSSGEMTAIALIGRRGVRVFGDPSGAYSTANGTFKLSDGALLILTTAFVADRTGKDYRGAIMPDVQTGSAGAEAAATAWLAGQCKPG